MVYSVTEFIEPKEVTMAKVKKTEKDFDTVKIFRTIKEKMSLEMAGMNFEEINHCCPGKNQHSNVMSPLQGLTWVFVPFLP